MPVTCFTSSVNCGFVGPVLATDYPEPGLQRFRINSYAFDRAGGRTLTRTDLCALESRAGRARGGQQALAVAQQHFSVCADIDDQ